LNRLRVLKQRVKRAGDVGVFRSEDGYLVATGRFWGDCAGPFSRRTAILVASRWALPSGPQIMTITTDTKEIKVTTNIHNESTSVERELCVEA